MKGEKRARWQALRAGVIPAFHFLPFSPDKQGLVSAELNSGRDEPTPPVRAGSYNARPMKRGDHRAAQTSGESS
jgi:hypothetical protein